MSPGETKASLGKTMQRPRITKKRTRRKPPRPTVWVYGARMHLYSACGVIQLSVLPAWLEYVLEWDLEQARTGSPSALALFDLP